MVEGLRGRAETIVDMEQTYPFGFPLGLLDKHEYAPYLHILKRKDRSKDDKSLWQGITGRTKQLLKEALKEQSRSINGKFEDVEQHIQSVETKIAGVKSKIDGKLASIERMFSRRHPEQNRDY